MYFIKKFEMTPTAANTITGLIYTISAIASPFLGMYGNPEKGTLTDKFQISISGILIDKTGRNMLYVFLSIVFTMIGI